MRERRKRKIHIRDARPVIDRARDFHCAVSSDSDRLERELRDGPQPTKDPLDKSICDLFLVFILTTSWLRKNGLSSFAEFTSPDDWEREIQPTFHVMRVKKERTCLLSFIELVAQWVS